MAALGARAAAGQGLFSVGFFGPVASLLREILAQLDLLPLQVAHLRGPQAVAIGDQGHRGVAMPVAAMLASAVHQALDLALGEIAPTCGFAVF